MNWLSKLLVALRALSFMTKRQTAKKQLLYILIVPLLFAACAITTVRTLGIDFDKKKADLIVKGQTTKQDIVKLLGQPFDKKLDQSGAEKWVYLYSVREMTGTDRGGLRRDWEGTIKEKKIEILFDQDVVKNFVASESTTPITRKTRF